MWVFEDQAFILFEEEVVVSLNNFQQINKCAPESGGLLLGEYRGEHIRVTAITAPFPLDIQSRTRFNRKDPNHFLKARELHSQTNGLTTIVGEWHTHPEPNPNPSRVDITGWKNILTSRIDIGLPCCFAIIGTESIWVGVNNFNKLNAIDPLARINP